MQLIPPDINIQFLKYAKPAFIASGTAVSVALLLWLILGLNYGIDFAGGVELQIRFNDPSVHVAGIREALKGTQPEPEVQHFGVQDGKHEYLVKLSNISSVSDEQTAALGAAVKQAFPQAGVRNFAHRTAGGDFLEFAADQALSKEALLAALGSFNLRVDHVTVEGAEGRFLHQIKLAGLTGEVQQRLEKAFGAGTFELLREESVGPKVGEDLRKKGLKSILFALLMILAYIAIRFSFVFAPGAVIALAHDVLITVGVFILLGVQFTIPTIAAMLTIVGYSLNDTIIVYDRIRENLAQVKHKPLEEVVNASLNQTLSRTLITSGTTLMVVICLMIFGSGVIYDFAEALLIGIIVGTYSSIYIASPIMIYLHRFMEARQGAAS